MTATYAAVSSAGADVVLVEAQRGFPLPGNGTLTPHATMTSMMTRKGLSLDAARTQILVEEATYTSI